MSSGHHHHHHQSVLTYSSIITTTMLLFIVLIITTSSIIFTSAQTMIQESSFAVNIGNDIWENVNSPMTKYDITGSLAGAPPSNKCVITIRNIVCFSIDVKVTTSANCEIHFINVNVQNGILISSESIGNSNTLLLQNVVADDSNAAEEFRGKPFAFKIDRSSNKFKNITITDSTFVRTAPSSGELPLGPEIGCTSYTNYFFAVCIPPPVNHPCPTTGSGGNHQVSILNSRVRCSGFTDTTAAGAAGGIMFGRYVTPADVAECYDVFLLNNNFTSDQDNVAMKPLVSSAASRALLFAGKIPKFVSVTGNFLRATGSKDATSVRLQEVSSASVESVFIHNNTMIAQSGVIAGVDGQESSTLELTLSSATGGRVAKIEYLDNRITSLGTKASTTMAFWSNTVVTIGSFIIRDNSVNLTCFKDCSFAKLIDDITGVVSFVDVSKNNFQAAYQDGTISGLTSRSLTDATEIRIAENTFNFTALSSTCKAIYALDFMGPLRNVTLVNISNNQIFASITPHFFVLVEWGRVHVDNENEIATVSFRRNRVLIRQNPEFVNNPTSSRKDSTLKLFQLSNGIKLSSAPATTVSTFSILENSFEVIFNHLAHEDFEPQFRFMVIGDKDAEQEFHYGTIVIRNVTAIFRTNRAPQVAVVRHVTENLAASVLDSFALLDSNFLVDNGDSDLSRRRGQSCSFYGWDGQQYDNDKFVTIKSHFRIENNIFRNNASQNISMALYDGVKTKIIDGGNFIIRHNSFIGERNHDPLTDLFLVQIRTLQNTDSGTSPTMKLGSFNVQNNKLIFADETPISQRGMDVIYNIILRSESPGKAIYLETANEFVVSNNEYRVGKSSDIRLIFAQQNSEIIVNGFFQLNNNVVAYQTRSGLTPDGDAAYVMLGYFDKFTVGGNFEISGNFIRASGEGFLYASGLIRFLPGPQSDQFKLQSATATAKIENNDIEAPVTYFIMMKVENACPLQIRNNNIKFLSSVNGSFADSRVTSYSGHRGAVQFFRGILSNTIIVEDNHFIFDKINPKTSLQTYYLCYLFGTNDGSYSVEFNTKGTVIFNNNEFSMLGGSPMAATLFLVASQMNNYDFIAPRNMSTTKKYLFDFSNNFGSLFATNNFTFMTSPINANFSSVANAEHGYARFDNNRFAITQTQFPLKTGYDSSVVTEVDGAPKAFLVSFLFVSSSSNVLITRNTLLIHSFINPLETVKTLVPLDFSMICLACKSHLFAARTSSLNTVSATSWENYFFANNTIDSRSAYNVSAVLGTTEKSFPSFRMFSPPIMADQSNVQNTVAVSFIQNTLASRFRKSQLETILDTPMFGTWTSKMRLDVGPSPCNRYGAGPKGLTPSEFLSILGSATYVNAGGKAALSGVVCDPTVTMSRSISFIPPPTTTSTTTTVSGASTTNLTNNSSSTSIPTVTTIINGTTTTAESTGNNANSTSTNLSSSTTTTAVATSTTLTTTTTTPAPRTPTDELTHSRSHELSRSLTIIPPPPVIGLSAAEVVAQETSARLVSGVAAAVAAPTAALANARALAVFTLIACPQDKSDTIDLILGWAMSPAVAAGVFIGIFAGGAIISLIYGFWLEYSKRKSQKEEDAEDEKFNSYAETLGKRKSSLGGLGGKHDHQQDGSLLKSFTDGAAKNDNVDKDGKLLEKAKKRTGERSMLEGAVALAPFPSIILKILAQVLPFWGISAGVLIGKLEIGGIILGATPIVFVFGVCFYMAYNVHKIVHSKNGPRVTQSLVYRASETAPLAEKIANVFLHPIGRFVIGGWFCWQVPRVKDLNTQLLKIRDDNNNNKSANGDPSTEEKALEEEMRDRQRCAALVTRFRGTLTKFWGPHLETEIEDLQNEARADLETIQIASTSSYTAFAESSSSSPGKNRKRPADKNNNNNTNATKKSYFELKTKLNEREENEDLNAAREDNRDDNDQLRPEGCKLMGYPDFKSTTWHYRSLLCPHFFTIQLVITVLLSMSQGFALAAPTQAHCRGAMRFIAGMNVALTLLTIFMRPFIIPMQNVFIITLDLTVTISSLIGAIWIAEGRTDLAAPIQLLCSLSSSIIGGLMVLNATTRLFCIQCIGIHIVPRVEIFRKMRRELKKTTLERMANEMVEIIAGEASQENLNNNHNNNSDQKKRRKSRDDTMMNNNDSLLGISNSHSSFSRKKSSSARDLKSPDVGRNHHHSTSSSRLKDSSQNKHSSSSSNLKKSSSSLLSPTKSSNSKSNSSFMLSPSIAPMVKSPELTSSKPSSSPKNRDNDNRKKDCHNNNNKTDRPLERKSSSSIMKRKKSHSPEQNDDDDDLLLLPASSVDLTRKKSGVSSSASPHRSSDRDKHRKNENGINSRRKNNHTHNNDPLL